MTFTECCRNAQQTSGSSHAPRAVQEVGEDISECGFLQKTEREGGKQGETRVSAQFPGRGANAAPVFGAPGGEHPGAEKESSSSMKDSVLSSVMLPMEAKAPHRPDNACKNPMIKSYFHLCSSPTSAAPATR